MSGAHPSPFFSCIVCAYNEGETVLASLESLAAQSFDDFEVIVVDDGADSATREALQRLPDARFRLVRQANDGLSSARNRGIAHARGRYTCFLDGDDTRPPWAFQSAASVLSAHEPDAMFCAGMLSELRNEIFPFYDTYVFEKFCHGQSPLIARPGQPSFQEVLPFLLLIEPQAANKFIATSLLKRLGLVFPNGHLFEDTLFHTGIVAGLRSVALCPVPSFTYFRRYGRAQITAGTGDGRLDAIAVIKMSLEVFSKSGRFSNVMMRAALLVSGFRLLQWCEGLISHFFRFQFHEGLIYLVETLDPAYLRSLKHYSAAGMPHRDVVSFIVELVREAAGRNPSGSSSAVLAEGL